MKGDFSRNTFDPRKHYRAVLMQQGRVQVDADWNEQRAIDAYLGESTTRDIIGVSGAPAEDPGFLIRVQDGKTLFIGAGHFYVDGILCENASELAYAAQPDVPGAPDPLILMQAANATTAIVYLDVWRRHLTALDDPAIREKALGGPDTATRVKTVWQIKVLPIKAAGPFGCGDPAAEWDALLEAPSGALHARAKPTEGAADPCILPPQAGYRRLENQLYRVEIHTSGALGEASFKWSRDNGAVVTAIESVSGEELTVRDLGPDETLGFASGQFVEITSDATELSGLPGQLLQISTVNPGAKSVRLAAAPGSIDLAGRPKLRRWDGDGEALIARPAENDGFLTLEDGVEVRFEPGDYRSGDYWLIPARTALDADTGQIEWPFDEWRLPSIDAALGKLLEGPPAERRVRITLKGHALWSEEGGRRRYLDGQAVGQAGVRIREGKTVPRIDLTFPSGSGRKASDFESWLYVPATIAPPRPTLTGFTLEPPSLIAGATAQGSLSLSGPAPAGLKITLTRTASPADPVETLPAELEVPAGQAFASFALKTKPNVAGTVFVQAKLDAVILSDTLEVTVVAVSISPPSASVVTNGQQQFTATVAGTANKAVTWSVQGPGSVTPAGLYRAPNVTGSAQVIAQSAVDQSKSKSAAVTITQKPKETKETKDIKDKDKEKEREKETKEKEKDRKDKEKEKEKEREKPPSKQEQLAKEKDRDDFIGPVPVRPAVSTSGRRRAFIRPEERPDLTPPPPPEGRRGREAPRPDGRVH